MEKRETALLLQYYHTAWDLIPCGKNSLTHSSILQPVIYQDKEAMLKIAISPEEKRGNRLMAWWDGNGAAEVYQSDDQALLMERISGKQSLKAMAVNGEDDQATRILCDVARRLHVSENHKSLPELIPLNIWFRDLLYCGEKYGPVIARCAALASGLLEHQSDITVLHGDLHHENVLYSSERGWLAIDPKGLTGERAFDYANILCNPDQETALSQGRLARQIRVISEFTGIPPWHLLQWTAAWAALSAVWLFEDHSDGSLPLEIAAGVLRELNGNI